MAANPAPKRIYTAHLFWDKKATHTDDLDSFLPLNRLAEYAAEGRIGSVSPRFYGVPTDYSQGKTLECATPHRSWSGAVRTVSTPCSFRPSDRSAIRP